MGSVVEAPLASVIPALQPAAASEPLPSPQTSAPFLASSERQPCLPRCDTFQTG